MTSTGFDPRQAWQWPGSLPIPAEPRTQSSNSAPSGTAYRRGTQRDEDPHISQDTSQSSGQSPRHYPSRTCRICFEVVPPTYEPPSINMPGIFNSGPSVTYESNDPASGKLIRPCKCKGSSRYVHEGCLQTWRHADPAYGRRNFWQCPTCGFRYKLERMRWGNWISSTATQIALTGTILFLAMFLLGFVGDPIINLYLDPYHTISSVNLSKSNIKVEPVLTDEDEFSWFEHFIKGLASLGLLGFVKVLFAMSPWQWFNLRGSGLMGGSGRPAGASGRDRLASISWIVVLIGVGTFLWGVYKGVRAWSRKTLEKAGERVMDVQADEDDDEGSETPPSQAT